MRFTSLIVAIALLSGSSEAKTKLKQKESAAHQMMA